MFLKPNVEWKPYELVGGIGLESGHQGQFFINSIEQVLPVSPLYFHSSHHNELSKLIRSRLMRWKLRRSFGRVYQPREGLNFIYRRPTLYPLEIAVDFLKSL
jgi:hypothetical protein